MTPDEPAVLRAVDALDAPYRTVVRLHYFEGLNAREIGASLGVDPQRVAELHDRAIRVLREEFTAVDGEGRVQRC